MIYVKICTLPSKTLTLVVQPSDTVENVKSKIEDKEGIPTHHQRLLLGLNQLEDRHTISTDYGGMTLHLLVPIKGN